MRRHSTATLMDLTKKELVEYVRMAEHNQDVAEEALRQQAENVKDWIPVVRCKDCKHRGDAMECPMCFEETSEWDDDGYLEVDYITHDQTVDDGFCDRGERRTDNGKQ